MEDLQKQIKALEKKVNALQVNDKKIKTPRAPRKPSEYNRFVSTTSVKIRNKNPNISQSDIMRECGRLWQEQKLAQAPKTPKTPKSPKKKK